MFSLDVYSLLPKNTNAHKKVDPEESSQDSSWTSHVEMLPPLWQLVRLVLNRLPVLQFCNIIAIGVIQFNDCTTFGFPIRISIGRRQHVQLADHLLQKKANYLHTKRVIMCNLSLIKQPNSVKRMCERLCRFGVYKISQFDCVLCLHYVMHGNWWSCSQIIDVLVFSLLTAVQLYFVSGWLTAHQIHNYALQRVLPNELTI